MRKLKSPLTTTKPVIKNSVIGLYSETADEIISVGSDESMTLAASNESVGQLKLGKYLAETPWVSSPVIINNKLSLITRRGILHQFVEPFEFLRKFKVADKDPVNDEE